jgi:O-antigen/teichoic acid export membrane protein
MSAAVSAVHLLVVLLLWRGGVLGLYAIFIAIVLEYLLGAVVLLRWLPRLPQPTPPASEAEPAWRSYLRYCLPLIPYSWIGFAYEFADRWLLQSYGGSVQQAYYAVSAQFASIALIATSSILNIFWKEIAESHYRGDHARTHRLYTRISRTLFLVGAIVAGFLSPWAVDLLRILLGTTYVAGASTLVIMFLYPVHQSLGQITGTMMYATERVMLSVVIGSVFMLLSIGVTYAVLAPADARIPGLGLASTGLALKMVGMQVLQTNVVSYVIARLWKWPFDWVFQPVALLGCLACGWLAHVAVTAVAPASWPTLTVIGLGGVSYGALIAAFLYAMPWLAGLSRNELVLNVATAWRLMGHRFKAA